jgi:glutathione peroxidase
MRPGKVHEQYKGKLVIVGFRPNNFGGQEPAATARSKNFASAIMGVTFPMAEKVP